MKFTLKVIITTACIIAAVSTHAQDADTYRYDKGSADKKGNIFFNKLYNYGVIDALIGGLYRGTLSISDLKQKGDFGLGAPDMIDGELMVLDGEAYQTRVNGKTYVLDGAHKTSFASVTFFKADTSFYMNQKVGKDEVLNMIEQKLVNKNAMYAIRITGLFDTVKTRAFPPVEVEPFPPLSSMLEKQQFFQFTATAGTFIGFHLPEYLNGINASGFHFHYLSNNKQDGGHIIDFTSRSIKIEIATLKAMELGIPDDEAFRNFMFKKKENEALKKVEEGK